MTDWMRHQVVRWRIPEHVMSGQPVKLVDRHHLDTCLRCQAEAANYRVIARALRAMRDSPAGAPPGLVGRVMANLSRPLADRRRGSNPVVVVASVVVVAAAMALLGRHRLRPAG